MRCPPTATDADRAQAALAGPSVCRYTPGSTHEWEAVFLAVAFLDRPEADPASRLRQAARPSRRRPRRPPPGRGVRARLRPIEERESDQADPREPDPRPLHRLPQPVRVPREGPGVPKRPRDGEREAAH